MKKVIICLLLLIPILVILTIDAGGKLIASALVDIPVESVVIKHGGEVLESDEIYLEEYKGTGKKYTVFCEVFPGIATDEMLWETSNEAIATIKVDEKRKDAAEITFHDYGSVDIICTSKKNSSISARATLYVGGLIPGYLTIGDYDGKRFEEVVVPRYAKKNLLASVKPARSVREEKIQWTSSAPTVATVDNNGVVTAQTEGRTTVTATVTAKGVTVTDTVIVRVEGVAFSTESVIYSIEETTDIALYLTEGVTAEGGTTVSLADIADFEAKEIVLHKGGEIASMHVVKLPSAASLVVENYYALKEGALKKYLALGTSNVELKAIAPHGDTPAYTWRSSDEGVVIVKGNRVYAVGSGSAVIYPEAAGYLAQSITINVTSPVEDFRLSETAYHDAVGLLQYRVFGNRTYQKGEYSPTYQIKIASVYPKGVGSDAFTFESANVDIATVDDNGVVTFAANVEGESVTISATAYNLEGLPVRHNYTFRLVNGVNIGVGYASAHFDKSLGELPDFAPYQELKAVAADRSVKAIVLHTDVYFPSKASGGTAIKNLSASIYGNGKKLDGQFLIDSVEETDKLLLWDFKEYPDMPKNVEVNILNVNMQSTQPTSEDAKEAFEELSMKGGGAIGTLNGYPEGEHSFRLFVKGCLFQYAYGHVNVAIGDSEFDGCIFRNNSASAIVLQQSSYGIANVKVRNCIFSNTIAPVGIVCGNFDDLLARFSGKSSARATFGAFELEGNNYVYMWKKLEEVQMDLLPRSLEDSDANALVNTFSGVLSKIIREAFLKSDASNLYVDENGDKWLNFSFLVLGIWEDMNPEFNAAEPTGTGVSVRFDPERCIAPEVKAYQAPSVAGVMSFARLIDVDLEVNKTYHIVARDQEGSFNTMPGETYTIDDSIYARLRGN